VRPSSTAVLALALPTACLGTAELLISVLSSGTDRPYVASFGGRLLLVQIALALVLGLGLMMALRRRREQGHHPGLLGLAVGISVALGVLTVLANGLPRKIPPGTVEPAAAWGLALFLGAAAGLLRRAAARRRHGPLALACEPLLIALVVVGAYGFLRLRRLPPATMTGSGVWIACAVAGLLAALLLGRLRHAPGPAVSWLLVALAVATGVGAMAAGSRPFPAVPARAAGPPDILLVVMDTTRADALPSSGRWATPAASRLAAEGRTFSRCFSTSCWTVPAHASLFTGRLPRGHGTTWDSPYLPAGPATLAERLAQAGWRTAGFSANPWIGTEFGFDRGFDRFVEADGDRRPLRPWAAAFLPAWLTSPDLDLFEDKGGLALVSEALRNLSQADAQPVFTFLNLMEPHLPYLPPRRFRDDVAASGWSRQQILAVNQDPLSGLTANRAPAGDQMEILRALYAAEIAYADSLLRRLLERLEESGRLDNTLVVVTSDHGENLGDHPPLDHQLGLFDSLVQVPLLMRYPAAVTAGSTDESLLSLAAVPGRILQLAGVVEAESSSPAGSDEPAVFFQYQRPSGILERISSSLGLDPSPWDRTLMGIRTATSKWIRASDGRHQAFDLVADPKEQQNLFTGGQAMATHWQQLAARLERRLPAAADAAPGTALDDITPATRERLRSLGYLD